MERSRVRITGDLAIAGVGLALAGFLWAAAADLPPSRYEPLGPGGFPAALALLLGALSAFVLLRALARGRTATAGPDTESRSAGKRRLVAAAIMVLTILYALAIDRAWAPFAISTAAYLVLAGAVLVGPATRREIALVVLVGTSGALAIHLLFKVVFRIDLP